MRLSIDITSEQHQCLKAAAALEGKSLKAYVLERALADIARDKDDLAALKSVIKSRLSSAESGHISDQSVEEVIEAVIKEETGS